MKIVYKILAWIFIIAFLTPTIILLFDFCNSAFEPSKDTYGIPILILIIASLLMRLLQVIPKFKSPKKKLKIGLDIHGICDTSPEYFAELTRLFVGAGHEVHLITGRRICDGALEEIQDLGLSYTHFFSIADYHEKIGTKVWEDDNGNPWLEGELWDKTKGEYCKKHKIDFHIDDTERYGQYFETPFMLSKIFKGHE
jgi:hypothetical protein